MNLKELSSDIRQKSEDFADVLSACSTILKYNSGAEKARIYLDGRLSKFYQDKFMFGYFPDNLSTILEFVSEEKLRKLGLLHDRIIVDGDCLITTKQSFFKNHPLIMPYRDLYGNIIGLVGRTLLSAEELEKINKSSDFFISKYKNTNFHKSQHIFGLYYAKKSIISNDFVIVVEGQFDCIACYASGFYNVVALGGLAFSRTQLSLLLRYTKNIYMMLDSDDRGVEATKKIIKKYSNDANFQTIELPKEYKDIALYLANNEDTSILSKPNK